jgi:polar amino acid transport system substrate-binding protein
MKRAGVLVGLIVALVLVAGCAATSQTSAPPQAGPVVSKILARGELLVGTAADMPPLNMTTKEGEIIGMEVDLAQALAGAMGVKLTLKPIAFPNLLSALENGQVDMVLSDVTITAKRNEKVAFAGPYFVSGKSVLTKSRTLTGVKDASQINSSDTTIVTLRNSTSQQFVETLIPKAKLVLADTYDAAVAMVLEDKVQALIADYPICIISVFRYPDKGLSSLLTPLTYEPIGIALPANDPLLVNLVQNFINTLEKSGELEKLMVKWFKDASWLLRLR